MATAAIARVSRGWRNPDRILPRQAGSRRGEVEGGVPDFTILSLFFCVPGVGDELSPPSCSASKCVTLRRILKALLMAYLAQRQANTMTSVPPKCAMTHVFRFVNRKVCLTLPSPMSNRSAILLVSIVERWSVSLGGFGQANLFRALNNGIRVYTDTISELVDLRAIETACMFES